MPGFSCLALINLKSEIFNLKLNIHFLPIIGCMLVSRNLHVMDISSSWNHVNVTVPSVPSINVDIQFARRHPGTRISHYWFAKIVLIAKKIKFLLEEVIIIMLEAKII